MLAFFLAIFFAVFTVDAKSFIHRGMELPEGYTEAPITWSGFDSHAAELAGLTFNGTVENVMAKLEAMGHPLEHPDPELNITSIKSKDGLPTKNRYRKCGVGGRGEVAVYPINAGVRYLWGLSDDVKCGNQPKTCGQISCSWWSAIWWCNDHYAPMEYKCNDMAVYAADVAAHCEAHNRCRGESGETGYLFRVVVGRAYEEC